MLLTQGATAAAGAAGDVQPELPLPFPERGRGSAGGAPGTGQTHLGLEFPLNCAAGRWIWWELLSAVAKEGGCGAAGGEVLLMRGTCPGVGRG